VVYSSSFPNFRKKLSRQSNIDLKIDAIWRKTFSLRAETDQPSIELEGQLKIARLVDLMEGDICRNLYMSD
jgi:hypothetical protein